MSLSTELVQSKCRGEHSSDIASISKFSNYVAVINNMSNRPTVICNDEYSRDRRPNAWSRFNVPLGALFLLRAPWSALEKKESRFCYDTIRDWRFSMESPLNT